MSLQAQIREWVDQGLHAVLDPLFKKVEKIEERLLALEQADAVPPKAQAAASRPAAAPAEEEAKGEPAAAPAHRSAPATRTGRPGGAAKGK